MTSVFFTLPISKFYLIAFTSSTLFLCPVWICLMEVDTGQGTASWCRESVQVGSTHAQQCSMFDNTPSVQHSWAVMFSVTQEELFPMAIWMKHWGPELISFSLLFIFELVVNKNRSTLYSLLFRQGESNSALCFACPIFSSKTIGDEHTSSSLESIKVIISAVIIIGLFLFRAETIYEGRMPMSKYMQERYLSQKCIFLLSRTTRG